MGKIFLVTGGSRSGKSGYAQRRAESIHGSRLFIATCPRIDAEIDERIERHILDRQGKGWETIEEERNLAQVIRESTAASVILVDCLTLWINNLLFSCKHHDKDLFESDINTLCKEIIDESRKLEATTIFVTNEVGSGIVPESANSRLYRDLVGRCNQRFAADADEVVLVSCGIPLTLKSNDGLK